MGQTCVQCFGSISNRDRVMTVERVWQEFMFRLQRIPYSQLEDDPYYCWLPMLTVPLHAIVLVAIAAFVGTQPLSLFAILILALTAGLYSGLGINTAHELGHKKPALERWLARMNRTTLRISLSSTSVPCARVSLLERGERTSMSP